MDQITIGRLSALTGVGVEAIRFYEREGLLLAPRRNESGYRQYGPDSVHRLSFIRNAKNLGFTLKEIMGLLNLKTDQDTTCEEVRLLAEEKLAGVKEKIKSLLGMEKALGELIGSCGQGGPDGECPILEALEPDWHTFLEPSGEDKK